MRRHCWAQGGTTMRIFLATIAVFAATAMAAFILSPRAVDACAGLIGSNGAVNLGRTTTLAAYRGGVEHYVTAFKFQGGGGEFGSLIPLPGVPTNVERGGDWTLQRLVRETTPPVPQPAGVGGPASGGGGGVSVLQEVRIDALDLTVLEGGGPAVALQPRGVIPCTTFAPASAAASEALCSSRRRTRPRAPSKSKASIMMIAMNANAKMTSTCPRGASGLLGDCAVVFSMSVVHQHGRGGR